MSGDVVVATINANGTSNTVTDNNGATSLTSRDFIDNPDSARYYVFDRVCTGSEPATLNFTLGTSARWSVVLRQYRGVDSSIWDVAPSGTTANTGSGDLTGELASITTATNGAVALALLSDDFNPTVTTFSSIDNGFGNVLTEAGQQFQTTADKTITTAGAVGITTITCTTSATISWSGWLCALKPASATLEQEGFRFGVDDGNEASHTWLAAQDTNASIDKGVNIRLRMIVNTTNDAPSQRYKLRYRKVGDDGWRDLGA